MLSNISIYLDINNNNNILSIYPSINLFCSVFVDKMVGDMFSFRRSKC